VVAQQGVHGMPGRRLEAGGNGGARRALADEAGIAAGAKGEAQRIEQDRFPGTGLPCQDRQPAREGEIEAIDQHHVADGEGLEHRMKRRGRRLGGGGCVNGLYKQSAPD
jgi:hypothetical protein